jgi:hypothetical protein
MGFNEELARQEYRFNMIRDVTLVIAAVASIITVISLIAYASDHKGHIRNVLFLFLIPKKKKKN